MKDGIEKRLAFIILDVVAIIAILGIVLLADLAEQPDKTTFQKLVLGDATKQIGANPNMQFPERINPCRAVRCQYGQEPTELGTTEHNIAVCACPNGRIYRISRTGIYAPNYIFEAIGRP